MNTGKTFGCQAAQGEGKGGTVERKHKTAINLTFRTSAPDYPVVPLGIKPFRREGRGTIARSR